MKITIALITLTAWVAISGSPGTPSAGRLFVVKVNPARHSGSP